MDGRRLLLFVQFGQDDLDGSVVHVKRTLRPLASLLACGVSIQGAPDGSTGNMSAACLK